jgi:cephalosporin hydroxylase
MIREATKALARRVPAIDALILQRDDLIRQRDDLLSEVAKLRGAANLSGGSELNALAERYYGSDANRKLPVYLTEYERLFGPMRFAPLRLLEIGVKFGASMLMWRDYFPNATIVGLDLAEKPPQFPEDPRIHFVRGSQDDTAALDEAVRIGGGTFDVIIDDASHLGYLTLRSFVHLFPKALKPGGFYVIEDICTSFLPSYAPEGVDFSAPSLSDTKVNQKEFPSYQNGMVGVVKQIFDHLMAPTATGTYSAFPVSNMIAMTNIAILQKAP